VPPEDETQFSVSQLAQVLEGHRAEVCIMLDGLEEFEYKCEQIKYLHGALGF
jgi:hypothetical protein